jgi:hypothetical protein
MLTRTLILLLALGATSLVDAQDEFTLGLETIDLTPRDPRTEARLAGWNSPMGRTEHHLREQQASILAGGMPGGPPAAIVFRAKMQKGFQPRWVVATSFAGVEMYERTIDVIRWPWEERDGPTLSIEEQLTLMLGYRLKMSEETGRSPPESE